MTNLRYKFADYMRNETSGRVRINGATVDYDCSTLTITPDNHRFEDVTSPRIFSAWIEAETGGVATVEGRINSNVFYQYADAIREVDIPSKESKERLLSLVDAIENYLGDSY